MYVTTNTFKHTKKIQVATCRMVNGEIPFTKNKFVANVQTEIQSNPWTPDSGILGLGAEYNLL